MSGANVAAATADQECPACAKPEPLERKRWLGLAVLLAGSFLPPLDFSIVNVALPEIRQSLAADAASVQLVISGYATAYAVLLIIGGRLGDIFGRRRIFLGGLFGFALASALCGFAWNPVSLVAGRILQGITAAILSPQALACIHALFPEREKPRAVGLYGVTIGLGIVAGQLLGGFLVGLSPFGLGWRAIFLINLPVVAVAVPAGFFLLKESKGAQRPHLDLLGAVLLALTLSTLIVPLIEGRERGWPVWAFASLAAFPLLATFFWRFETRVLRSGRDPLFVPSILKVPGIGRLLGATLCLYSMSAFFLTFPIYYQLGLGRDAIDTGIAILPLGIGFLLGNASSPYLAYSRFSPALATVGLLSATAGLVLTLLVVRANLPALFIATLPLIGAGQGIALPALVRAVIARVEIRYAGLASGLFSATLQISAALGVALIGGLFFSILGERHASEAVTAAFSAVMIAVSIALASAAWLALPKR